jgi:hypothetical protein
MRRLPTSSGAVISSALPASWMTGGSVAMVWFSGRVTFENLFRQELQDLTMPGEWTGTAGGGAVMDVAFFPPRQGE